MTRIFSTARVRRAGEAPGQIDRRHLAGLGPALDRDLAVAGVDADDDPAGVVRRGAPDEIGVAQCRRAEHDPVNAEIEPAVDCGAVADAAAELDPQIDRAADRAHRLAIDRAPGKGAVEIDDMQPSKAHAGEGAGLRRRVVVEHGSARHLAADQAHALTALQVDRRIEDHAAGSSRRL